MRKVNFLLPVGGVLRRNPHPVGGFKIIYEYANMLVNNGFQVNIMLPATLLWKERSLSVKLKGILLYILGKIDKKFYDPRNWFDLNKKVRVIWIPSLEEKYIPDADFTVASAAETAEYLNKYSNVKGKKLYLIQGYEEWYFNKERLINTYKFGFKNIVIAEWLKEIVDHHSETESILIENGLDFNEFKMEIPIKNKDKYSISMLYHASEWKGSRYGIEALKILKKKYPALKANLFGIPPRPKELPKWINYYQSPTRKKLNKIYNKSALHLGTSFCEGWGLTVCEAMMTGAAVVATRVNGYKEFCHDNKTSLLVESKDSKEMANRLEDLINDDSLRYEIAKEGKKNIKKYTWERAYNKFENILEEL